VTDEERNDKVREFEKMLEGLTRAELGALLAIAKALQAEQQQKKQQEPGPLGFIPGIEARPKRKGKA